MAYQKGEARMPQPGHSVKIESESYFGNDGMACTSMQYSSQDYNSSHVYTTGYPASFNDDSIHSSAMFPIDMQEYLQESGYYDTEGH